MQRRAFLGAVGALAGTAGCLAGATGGLDAEGYDVGMSSNAFLTPELEIEAGERVVWGNTSSRAHTVTAVSVPEGADYFASGGFESRASAVDAWQSSAGIDLPLLGDSGESGAIQPGETYAHTFEEPGTYDYYCIPHAASNMDGKIVVRE